MLGARAVSIGQFVNEHGLSESWDPERETSIIDEDKCRDALIDEFERPDQDAGQVVIIEGVMADIIADKAELAVVLRLHPAELRGRLASRGYPRQKINENVQAEVLGTCTHHMMETRGKDFLDIDTTGKDAALVAGIISGMFRGDDRLDPAAYKPGLVDWIQDETLPVESYFE